jgi:hypothetical protein
LPFEDFVYETLRGAIGDTMFEAVQQPGPRTVGCKGFAGFFSALDRR